MSDRRPALSFESDAGPPERERDHERDHERAPSASPGQLEHTESTVQVRIDGKEDALPSEEQVGLAETGAPHAVRIGRYAVLELLGQGGMGTVYAVYDDRLDRRVALKLLKAPNRGEGRKRMLREAQAMAKLSHPNVVPVFEVGEHDRQLFLVMEHVEGVNLDQWRRETKRSWREVLDTYLQAGRGLAAAHAEGLVHRDFKPHNALIGRHGRVRVLDFGLATRLGDRDPSTDGPSSLSPQEDVLDTPLTHPGDVMGTPAYMPAEQFEGREVDHRSDQFSFCVALWEALYGRRPFEPASPDGDTPPRQQLQRRVQAGEIVAPDKSETPARIRAVLERGLSPSPDARWPDLSTLLAELERSGVEPGQTRRRVLFTLAAVGLIGASVTGLEAWTVWDQERRGEACEVEANAGLEPFWNPAAREAVAEGLRSTGVSYAESTATNTLLRLEDYAGSWTTARAEACSRTKIEESWDNDDLERSRWCLDRRAMALRSLVAQFTSADQGVAAQAVYAAAGLPQIQPCLDADLLRRLPSVPTARDRAIMTAIREQLSLVAAMQSTGNYDAAIIMARSAFEDSESLNDPAMRATAGAALGSALDDHGKYPEAEAALEQAYFEAVVAHHFEAAFQAASSLALVVGYRGERYDEGRRWNRLARVALVELGVGEDALEVAQGLGNEGLLLHGAGNYKGAEQPLRRAIEVYEGALGPDHPGVARALANLAMIHGATGDYEQAKSLYARSVQILTEALGPDHPGIARALNNLAVVHRLSGEYDLARSLHERALSLRERAFGPDHPDVAESLNNLSNVQVDLKNHDVAKTLLERAIEITEAIHGPEHPSLARSLDNLGFIYSETGDYAKATALRIRALSIKEATMPPDHPSIAITLNNLASVRFALDEYPQAIALHERALAIRKKSLSPNHPHIALTLTNLADVYSAAGLHVQAAVSYSRAVAIYDTRDDTPSIELRARRGLAESLVATGGDADRAILEAQKAAEGYRNAGEEGAQQLAEVEAWLAEHRR